MSFCYTFIGLHSPLYTRITFPSSSNISPYSPNGAFITITKASSLLSISRTKSLCQRKKTNDFLHCLWHDLNRQAELQLRFQKNKKAFHVPQLTGNIILYKTDFLSAFLAVLFYPAFWTKCR